MDTILKCMSLHEYNNYSSIWSKDMTWNEFIKNEIYHFANLFFNIKLGLKNWKCSSKYLYEKWIASIYSALDQLRYPKIFLLNIFLW
jgi:hypothetical protein